MAYKNRADALAAQKRWYEANRDSEIAKALVRNKANKAATRAYLQELKENTPCADCGINYPYYVMDFDHISDDKFKNINTMMRENYSLTEIQKEIDKCELVCANCHRIRTHQRRIS